ncbi:MAG TPA: MFS transporter [Acidimicrobiales bacterium]|nr:MFS transporter [Acidimicrobiales bacterium]
MIDLKDVTVVFGDRRVLDEVELHVEPGEIVAVVGPNGSGKTSLLDVAAGELAAAGTRHVGGRIGRGFQDDDLFPSLTVAESLSAAGAEPGMLSQFGLEAHADRWPNELSTGIRRVVEIAIATAARPEILLLDEPSAGLARAEVDNLAGVIRKWRDESRGSVLLVEHDRDLVAAVADRALELRDGRLHEIAPAGNDAASDPASPPPGGDHADLPPRPTPAPYEAVSIWRLMRWGLREFAAGLLSVLVVGVLNRVMAVELGVSLTVVSLVVGGYNLAAPLALPLGHRSDRRPLFGYRRSGYVVLGAIVTGVAACFAPDAGHLIARSGTAGWAVALGVGLFGLMGLGMYGSGTAFFSLLADQCPPRDRARAAAVVYTQLMLGILAGVALTATALDGAGRGELRALFVVVGSAVAILSTLAVWGTEPRWATADAATTSTEAGSLRQSLREFVARPEAVRFFTFLLVATTALFLQQTILEPFGGVVLGLSVGQSTGFNAVLIIGVLAGMGVGARSVAPRLGVIGLAASGLVVSATAFGVLSVGAAAASAELVWPALAVLGLGTGLFNVAGLTLMMGLSRPGAVGLAMGSWTLSHAIADGLATSGGGAAFDLARNFTDSAGAAFAIVFAAEGVILLALLPLLARLSDRTIDGALGLSTISADEGELPVGLEDADLHAP